MSRKEERLKAFLEAHGDVISGALQQHVRDLEQAGQAESAAEFRAVFTESRIKVQATLDALDEIMEEIGI